MDNLNLLCQSIRFQRTALQNSLAMIAAVQQHGEKLLKTTLEQSPWIPGEGKDACLFWAGIWKRNLTGITDLVDKNLATMERLTSTEEKKEAKTQKPAERSVAPEKQPAPAAKEMTEKKQTAPPAGEQEKPVPVRVAEQTAMTVIEAQKAPVSALPPEEKPEQPPCK